MATLLALAGSWTPSLWGDEAASVLSAERPLPSLFSMLRHVDAVHGTYYFALHWWVALFGSSAFSVRLPSAIAVGLGAIAVVKLCRTLASPRVALVAGVVYCLLPRVTYMGEEARAYAFDAAIAAWLLVALVRLIKDPAAGRRWWVLYGLLLSASIYLFLYLGLFIAVHAVVLAAARVPRETWRRWLFATVGAVVVAAPVIVFSLLERSQVSYLASRNDAGFSSVMVGVFFSSRWVAVVAWALIFLGVGSWVRRLRRDGRSGLSLEVAVYAWLFVPGGILLLSNVVVADFSSRYLSMSAPAAAIAIAVGIDRLARRRAWLGVVATAVVVALCVPTYLAQRTPYAKNSSDWAEISSTVGAHASAGQAILFDESTRPSRRPRLAMNTYPAGFRGLVDVSLQTPAAASTTWHDTALTVRQTVELGRLQSFGTVWLVDYATGSTVDPYGRADLEAAGYRMVATYRTHRSEIIEFSRSATDY